MGIDAIYNAKILDYAGNIARIGRLEQPDGTAKAHSKLCGSTVVVDVAMRDGAVSDYAHDVKACALGQAAAAIMAENVIGATVDELRSAKEQLRAMLKDHGPAPDGRFAALEFLMPVRDYKARHASTMLAFDATLKAAEHALAEAPALAVESAE